MFYIATKLRIDDDDDDVGVPDSNAMWYCRQTETYCSED
jgi:hypothetical protein